MERKTISLDEFQAAIRAQGVPVEHVALKCPMCGTIQSATDLIRAGAGADMDAVEKYLGFACVGRFTNAGPYKPGSSQVGCDWTLGGLFQLHLLEVVTPDGKRHPRFEIASPETAQAHMRASEQQAQTA